MKSKIGEKLLQFIKFGIVGISNTVISYVVYIIGVYIGLHYLVSSVLGFVISVFNSYYWNNKYVFKEDGKKRSILQTLLKTFIAYGVTGLILNNILLVLWIDILKISEYIAPIINLIITVPLNFILNKLWAFKVKD